VLRYEPGFSLDPARRPDAADREYDNKQS